MNNLGLYKTMVTLAKKVGSPVGFLGIVAAGGYVVLRTVEGGIRTVITQKARVIENETFTVTSSGIDEQGLSFAVGDQFRVMEWDGDTVQIEKMGNVNNPYFVSAEFLRSISNFPGE